MARAEILQGRLPVKPVAIHLTVMGGLGFGKAIGRDAEQVVCIDGNIDVMVACALAPSRASLPIGITHLHTSRDIFG